MHTHHHVHNHYHNESSPEVLARLDVLCSKLDLFMETIMPSIDELQIKAKATLDKVTSDTDIDNAIAKVVNDQNATITDLKAQLAAAGTDPAKLQALSDTMDAILNTDTSNAAIVANAVTAGTPAA
jgi:septal ring factor EnvC (AmiA/AmiB activator)